MSLLLLLIASFLTQTSLYEAYVSSLEPAPSSPPLPAIYTTKFTFTSFNPESCSTGGLICTGSASSGDGVINLTIPPELPGIPFNQVGRIVYKYPVLAWPATISTTFTIRIVTPLNSHNGADGLTFIMAPDLSPSPPNSFGSNLGITNPSLEGVAPRQIAVEFDTYKNTFDIDGNHIGIDTNSVKNSITSKSLNLIGIDLKSGKDIRVRIDYDGRTKWLQVSLGYSSGPLMNFLSWPIEISAYVPEAMYVGFTASTGNLFEHHQLLDWEFTSTPIAT